MDVLSDWLQQVLEAEGKQCKDFVENMNVLHINNLNYMWHDLFFELRVCIMTQVFNQSNDKLKHFSRDNLIVCGHGI